MKIFKSIAAITAKLAKSGIAKDRENTTQHYRFRGIDDVYNALAPLLSEHGVVIVPSVTERSQREQVTAKGTTLLYTVVGVEYALYSADDGSNCTVKVFGEAMDSGDKSTIKAMSAAYKTAALQVFCIPTEGDNDADASSYEVGGRLEMTEQQLKNFLADIETAVGLDALKGAYDSAVREAKEAGDKAAFTKIVNAKNKRKAQIVGAEPGPSE
jgi:hypothetical protein